MRPLAQRAAFAPVVLLVVAALTYATPRVLRLDLYAEALIAPTWATPWSDPWRWLRELIVPWLVLAAPLGAMCLRITLGNTLEALDEDYVRTAIGKGLPMSRVVRRHAARASLIPTASFVGVSIPLLVTNAVLIERVFSVPGFFQYTWTALGHVDPPGRPDYPMLEALTVWSTLLIVVLGVIADALLPLLDPRQRRE
jgi:ABC-type dipeptide/oligopeptide/nickel transport system permease component